MGKYTKLDVAGAPLPDDAEEFASVLDSETNLAWQATTLKRMTFKAAEKAAAAIGADWRLPTVKELLTLVDYARYSPAIDTAFFPDTETDWYWTNTPAAYSPADYAWFVGFSSGYSSWLHRDGKCFVRAVRSVSPAAASQ